MEDDFDRQVWMVVWDQLVAPQFLPQEGDTVYLATDDGVIRWRTEVTEIIRTPFEHADAFREHIGSRFGEQISLFEGGSPAPGFGIAWKAKPIESLFLQTAELGVTLTSYMDSAELDPLVVQLLDLHD